MLYTVCAEENGDKGTLNVIYSLIGTYVQNERNTMSGIRVLVNGAKGRMGREASEAVEAEEGLNLVARTDLGDDLGQSIIDSKAHVVVDFTTASDVFENSKTIIASGAHPVIGTSGLLPDQVKELQ